MDAAVTGVAMAALVADGILAGLSLDRIIVQLPARQRIGVTAYAAYARAADLGNGAAFYTAAGVGAAALTLAAFAVAAALGAPGAVSGLVVAAAAGLSLLHSAATGRAAPTMFQIGGADDTDAALAPLLARFARRSAVRACPQAATLIVVAIAVAVGT
jgi:hypothetical protein